MPHSDFRLSRRSETVRRWFLAFSLIMAVSNSALADKLIDPKAIDLLKRMSGVLAKAETLRFKAYTLFDDFEDSGVKYKRGILQEFAVRRPNRMYFRSTADRGWTREGWYDGKTFTVAMPDQKAFARIEAPPTLDGLLNLLQEKYRVFVPTIDVLYADLYANMRKHVLSAVHVGIKNVDRTALDHISLETKAADVQIWVKRDRPAVPRRMVVNFVALKGKPEYLVVFRDWRFEEFMNEGAFRFEVPNGWNRVQMPKQ